MNYEIFETSKLSPRWAQELAVARKGSVFLRIAGDGTNYRVMTATAAEDDRAYLPCSDQPRLWAAAMALAERYNQQPEFSCDHQGRTYVRIFEISQPEGETTEGFTESVLNLLDEFFGIFDTIQVTEQQKRKWGH